jgi:hypothetical protein
MSSHDCLRFLGPLWAPHLCPVVAFSAAVGQPGTHELDPELRSRAAIVVCCIAVCKSFTGCCGAHVHARSDNCPHHMTGRSKVNLVLCPLDPLCQVLKHWVRPLYGWYSPVLSRAHLTSRQESLCNRSISAAALHVGLVSFLFIGRLHCCAGSGPNLASALFLCFFTRDFCLHTRFLLVALVSVCLSCMSVRHACLTRTRCC